MSSNLLPRSMCHLGTFTAGKTYKQYPKYDIPIRRWEQMALTNKLWSHNTWRSLSGYKGLMERQRQPIRTPPKDPFDWNVCLKPWWTLRKHKIINHLMESKRPIKEERKSQAQKFVREISTIAKCCWDQNGAAAAAEGGGEGVRGGGGGGGTCAVCTHKRQREGPDRLSSLFLQSPSPLASVTHTGLILGCFG